MVQVSRRSAYLPHGLGRSQLIRVDIARGVCDRTFPQHFSRGVEATGFFKPCHHRVPDLVRDRFFWLFGDFRGSSGSCPGIWCRRLAGWTRFPRTMPGFWASTTPGESMLLTFGSRSGESKSACRTTFRAFPARNAANPAAWPITQKSGVGDTSTRCSSRPSWSPGDSCVSRRPRHSPGARAEVGDLCPEAVALLSR